MPLVWINFKGIGEFISNNAMLVSIALYWIVMAGAGLASFRKSIFWSWQYCFIVVIFAPVIVPIAFIAQIIDWVFPSPYSKIRGTGTSSEQAAVSVFLLIVLNLWMGWFEVSQRNAHAADQPTVCVCKK